MQFEITINVFLLHLNTYIMGLGHYKFQIQRVRLRRLKLILRLKEYNNIDVKSQPRTERVIPTYIMQMSGSKQENIIGTSRSKGRRASKMISKY